MSINLLHTIDYKHKTLTVAALFLMLAMTVSMVALPAVNAHDPPWTYQMYARISVAPDPVGVGQSVLLVAAVDWAFPGGDYYNDVRPENIDIIVTKPDGTSTTVAHFDSAPDSGGSAFTSYTPDVAGVYTVQTVYHDTVYRWNSTNTPGLRSSYNQYYGDVFKGSTATNHFTVQEEPVGQTVVWPLPTEYWTRPIFGDNYAWDVISSNWLAGMDTGGASISTGAGTGDRWQQDGTAPHTAHIMWTKPIEFGGVTGGVPKDPNAFVQEWYSGMAYQVRFLDPVVIGGVLIYNNPLAGAGGGGGLTAVDMRTGEVKWERPDLGGGGGLGSSSSMFGMLTDFGSGNQHGTYGAILFIPQGGGFFGGPATWVGYDAFTGKDAYNITNVPSGFQIFDRTNRFGASSTPGIVSESTVFQSTIYADLTIYCIDYDTEAKNGTLALWSAANTLTRDSISWNAGGSNPTGDYSYVWNITLPDITNVQKDGTNRGPTILGVIPNDILVGTSSLITLTYLPRQPSYDDPWDLWAISLNPDDRGRLIYHKFYDKAPGNLTRMTTMYPLDPVARTINMRDFNTENQMGFDADTGTMIWNTFPNGDQLAMNPQYRPLQWYSAREAMQAYGNFYVAGYGGEVFCYDNRNGTLLWKYNSTNTVDYTNGQPWGLQPLHMAAFADNMLFLCAGEHSPSTPLYTGYRMVVLDAFTGEKVWDLFAWSSSGLGTSIAPMAIADGFLSMYNCYDGQIYTLGKGPSATTVTASPKVSTFGDKVLVEGTVMDICTGASQFNVAPRFPSGLPAVSDASMTPWMEYVYEQKPRPSDTVGVDVVLSVLDPNNNVYDVETVTSDAAGTFAYTWDPLVPGEYTLFASFAGSESYWPSFAQTHVTVQEAPAASPTPTPPPASMTDTYVAGFGVAILVVIIAGIVVIILMLRRR